MRRRTLLILLLAVTAVGLLLIGLFGLSGGDPEKTAFMAGPTAGTSVSMPVAIPSNTTPAETIPATPLPTPAQPAGPLVEDSRAVAMSYQALVRDSEGYAGTAVSLRDSDYAAILSLLAQAGLVAFDSAGQHAATNVQIVSDFFAALEDPAWTGTLTLFEICPDGGFLRHDIQVDGAARMLTLTRLTWAGEEPVVTYSSTYGMTRLALSADGCISYDYDFPDNPAGGNHDGHVDTATLIQLNP